MTLRQAIEAALAQSERALCLSDVLANVRRANPQYSEVKRNRVEAVLTAMHSEGLTWVTAVGARRYQLVNQEVK